MKTLFIEAKKKFNDGEINYSLLDRLPGKKISLAATIQYIDLIPKVKKYLESKDRQVLISQGAFYKGHVLGCQSQAFDKSADTFLLITDGKFHAINNAIQLKKEIYVFTTNSLEKLSNEEVETELKKIQAKQKKFLMSRKVGILISTKQGQNFASTKNLKAKLTKLGKKPYILIANDFDTNQFENFPEIDIWVNTACFGLARDHNKIINLQDILEFI